MGRLSRPDAIRSELRIAAERNLGDVRNDGSLEEELRVHEAELEVQNEELRTSQFELERSREQFFELYDLAPVGYLKLTSRGEIRRSNIAAAAMLGTDRAQMEGKPLAVYLESASKVVYYNHIESLFSKGFVESCEVELEPVRRENSSHSATWVQLTSARARDESDGEILLAMTDISPRVRAESILRDQEARLRAISNQGPLAIAVVAHDGRLLESNVGWSDLFGGIDFGFGDKICDRFSEGRSLATALRSAEPSFGPIELQVLESESPVSVKGSRIPGRGAESEEEWLLLLTDLSDRRRAEARAEDLEGQLQEAQLARLRALGELAGGIAHDFNNSLAAILSGVESASLTKALPDEAAEDLTLARDAALSARSLVRRILAFARPEDSVGDEFDLAESVAQTFALVRAAAPSGVEMVVADLEPMPVGGNRTQIDQVLVNVLTNAVQACSPSGGGRVEVSARWIDAVSRDVQNARLEGEAFWEVSIHDSGVGIPAETQGRIFDPYFTTRAEFGGTGFGLATAHGVVVSHGGALNVESLLGEGATFRIILPARAELDGRRPRVAGPIQRSKTLAAQDTKILVVDDELGVRESCRHVLRHLGAEVMTCETADEALALIQEDPKCIDMLITDLTMPRHSGLWLIRGARKVAPELPITLLTGNRSRIDAEELAVSRPNVLLEKPVTLEELEGAVRQCAGEI